ncbi:MAG TPA: DUF3536 domain-containing protein [Methanoregulaceae archaeon]|nr:DUF3536 domain-containing protein [Methanoregulaceae archaeon]
MTDRAVCIHGHFYQPPREDPWLEQVALQPTAAPFLDWNERVTAECYRPFSAARLLAPDGRVESIVNLYARISFNIGPTLFLWLERHAPDVCAAVLEADAASLDRCGHGAALAQGYHHAILPLADPRDRATEVAWGVRDFEARFGRPPEGFWLPEMAVDVPTLEALAAHGIRFTLLAPHQAARVREPGGTWYEVDPLSLDLNRPYLCPLPSGRSIAVFFSNSGIAHDLAFGSLLANGDRFADRLLACLAPEGRDQLVSVALDGETFGHHQTFGEMGLARAIRDLDGRSDLRVTVFGEFLERHPPGLEVEVRERTSWSCAHGVERWRADCGCASGLHPGWSQGWRAPLRRGLEALRETLRHAFEAEGNRLFRDPWAARSAYVDLVRDPSAAVREAFLARHAARPLPPEGERRGLLHLELQRHLLMSFTSCGWFFDDIAGIEPVQVLRYAARACQLARQLGLPDPEPALVETLGEARGNTPGAPDAAAVWRDQVAPFVLDWPRLAAHFAVGTLWADGPCTYREGQYTVVCERCHRMTGGRFRFATGTVCITADRTRESRSFSFGVLIGRDGSIRVGIGEDPGRDCPSPDDLERVFSDHLYPAGALSARERRAVYERLMRISVAEAVTAASGCVEDRRPLLSALGPLGLAPPPGFAAPVALVLEAELASLLDEERPDASRIAATAADLARLSPGLYDGPRLARHLGSALLRLLGRTVGEYPATSSLEGFAALVDAVRPLGLEPDRWRLQNLYIDISQQYWRQMEAQDRIDRPAGRLHAAWAARFSALAGYLGVHLP